MDGVRPAISCSRRRQEATNVHLNRAWRHCHQNRTWIDQIGEDTTCRRTRLETCRPAPRILQARQRRLQKIDVRASHSPATAIWPCRLIRSPAPTGSGRTPWSSWCANVSTGSRSLLRPTCTLQGRMAAAGRALNATNRIAMLFSIPVRSASLFDRRQRFLVTTYLRGDAKRSRHQGVDVARLLTHYQRHP
jgi:hypothetical protein